MKQIGFTKEELYEINDAVVPLLRRYLETGDPEGHERQHGTMTNLLGITKKVAIAVFGEGGLPAWLVELEHQVAEFKARLRETAVATRELEPTPVVGGDAFRVLCEQAAKKGIAVPSWNTGRFPWDYWEVRALVAGVSPELADLGRSTMREHYQHSWEDFADEVSIYAGEAMLKLALADPKAAHARWTHLLETDGERVRRLPDGRIVDFHSGEDL
jgi:hypothetical protein